ncbi:MAG: glucosyl-3-phosphoglycerate synthase [Methanosarcinales archaeon]|nr:glucosyl-3-phosphoglycerate synthase [Methanosarcinales archaeon]
MDFRQEWITTIHDFRVDERTIISSLEELKDERPMTLLIPMLYDEIHGNSLDNIVDHINGSTYLSKVIIALAAEDEKKYVEVKNFFSRLKIPNTIVWCNGPTVSHVIEELKERGLDITMFSGKGKDTWISLGVASLDSYAIAMHDADVMSYSKLLPAKLFYPIVEPDLGFFFNKGYYARIDMDNLIMYGRVYRLLLSPLLNTLLEKTNYSSNFLKYMCAFKYPLSGEFGMTSDLAINIRIPGDWGLEVGLLAEVYKSTALKRISQVDLEFYEHKHRTIGTDSEEGILKMIKDITKSIFRNLVEVDGIDINEAFLQSANVLFKRIAQDRIRQYHADALCNGLNYSRHAEECMVEEFSRIMLISGKEYIDDPSGVLLPDWKRAISAMPDIRETLKDAALHDYNTYK